VVNAIARDPGANSEEEKRLAGKVLINAQTGCAVKKGGGPQRG
jgi:hypothetical protein